MNRAHPNNDWYQELCALAAIGEASHSEVEELQQHLTESSDCRELYADFRRIASDDLGTVAVLKQIENSGNAVDALNEDELLSSLLERAGKERQGRAATVSRRRPIAERGFIPAQNPLVKHPTFDYGYQWVSWLRQPALSYGSLALILCAAAAVGAYRLREIQLRPSLERLDSQVQSWQTRARSTEAQEESVSASLKQAQAERESLQRSLTEAQTKYAQWLAAQQSLQAQLTAERAQLDQQASELQGAKKAGVDKDKHIADLQGLVQDALYHAQLQRQIAEDLRKGFDSAQRQVAELESRTPEAQGFTNADAEQIFGARDLHIVDVYDVDSRGTTKRTYGRVYYVEKKLLIFYAFDLQDKKHNREAMGFQAWGYREANESHPASLGLFHLDDLSTNRWVLRVNNPGVLQHVDAVFVTLEPADGSPFPRGHKLLYANLLLPPNHP